MSKIQKFLEYIKEKTNNKYDFLKLKQLYYDKSKNVCYVYFIYPEIKEVTDDEKQEIINVIKEYIKIDGRIDVDISKSFVENDLVKKKIERFLQVNYPMFYNSFNLLNLDVSCGEVVRVCFNLEDKLVEYFTRYNIDKGLMEFLSRNFCANFDITYRNVKDSSVQNKMLEERKNIITAKSDMDALLANSNDKFIVSDKRVIVGDEISLTPRYIKKIDRTYDLCAVAGKISFLTERTYKSKFPKKTKTGEEVFEEKPYFSFQVKDDSGTIYAVIFPSKANYHKMHLLKNDDTVIVQGKIQKFNENYEIMARHISLCKIPNKKVIEKIADQNLITDYRYVRPQKYTSQRQVNLFDTGKNYSKEIMNGSFVVYDFETTGIKPEVHEIIEIGALKIVNGEYKEVFSTLVKPKELIPAEATKVNRITNDMVSQSYSIEQVIRDFYLFCKGSQMVGYNSIAFDSLFLNKAAKSVGISFENEQLDAFLMAKQKLRGLRNYKLGTVASYLDVNLIDAHRALNDVLATAEVFLKLY